jgi:hypothetical protein
VTADFIGETPNFVRGKYYFFILKGFSGCVGSREKDRPQGSLFGDLDGIGGESYRLLHALKEV